MGIEEDIHDLRNQVSELTALFLSTLSDQQIATGELSNERLTEVIRTRSGTSSFHLTRKWTEHGTALTIEGTRRRGKNFSPEIQQVPQSVVDYCAKLEAFGLKINIENPEPPK
jgi:hypothetical protein